MKFDSQMHCPGSGFQLPFFVHIILSFPLNVQPSWQLKVKFWPKVKPRSGVSSPALVGG